MSGAPHAPRALVARERFERWMTRHKAAPAVMVSGGAGYGKTSALLSWARAQAQHGTRIAWVTLDAELVQREAFWSVAMHHISSLGLAADEQFLEVLRHPAGAPARALLPLLLQQFAPHRPPVVLVVDRGDLAAGSLLVEDLVRLSEQPSSLRVILTTRRRPAGTHMAERLGDSLAAMPTDLLLFDSAELAQLASAMGEALPDAERDTILKVTGGWPLAVSAELAHRLNDDGEDTGPTGEATAQLGSRLIDDLRARPGFWSLLPLSVAESFDDAVMRRLGGSHETLLLLDECAASGLGTYERKTAAWRFRFEPVLRRALHREFVTTDPHGGKWALEILAAVREERGDLIAALDAAVAAEDWSRAVRVVQRRVQRFASPDPTYSEILRRIPAPAQRRHPQLLFAVGYDDFMTGRHTSAFRRFETFVAGQGRRSPQGRPSVDDVWIQFMTTFALRLLGRHQHSAHATARLMRFLERADDPDGELDEATAAFLSHAALSLLMVDRTRRALSVLGEAGDDVLPDRPSDERARILAIRAFSSSYRGNLNAARDTLDCLSALQLPSGHDATWIAAPRAIAQTRVLLEEGKAQQAERILERTETQVRSPEFWPFIVEGLVRATLFQRGPAAALAALDQRMSGLLTRLRLSAATSALLATLRIDLLLGLGRITDAHRAATQSFPRRSPASALARSRIRLFDGDARSAASIAGRALQAPGTPAHELSLEIVAAAASIRLEDDRRIVQHHLRRATQIASRERMFTPFTMVPATDLRAILTLAPELRDEITPYPGHLAGAPKHVALTQRERIVLARIADGKSVAETAAELSVSVNTVKAQRRSLYRKLGVSNRTAALDEARRRNIY